MNETIETIFEVMPLPMRQRMIPVLPNLEQALREVAGVPHPPHVVLFVIATEQTSVAVAMEAVECAGSSFPVIEDEGDRALIQQEISDLINRPGAAHDDFSRAVGLVFSLMTKEVRPRPDAGPPRRARHPHGRDNPRPGAGADACGHYRHQDAGRDAR